MSTKPVVYVSVTKSEPTKPMKPKELGSSHATKARTQDNRMAGDDGKPLMTSEEHKQLKLMEALNERAKIEKLRKDNAERWKAERKYTFSQPKP